MKNIIFTYVLYFLIPVSFILGIYTGKCSKNTQTVYENPEAICHVDTLEFKVGKDYHTTASFYADKFHGRKTAAPGEVYNMNAFTAAHPNLPFGTYVQVNNVHNDKFVIVRINDRGPFKLDSDGVLIEPLEPHPTRRIDLSYAAFKQIANPRKGLIKVHIQVLKPV